MYCVAYCREASLSITKWAENDWVHIGSRWRYWKHWLYWQGTAQRMLYNQCWVSLIMSRNYKAHIYNNTAYSHIVISSNINTSSCISRTRCVQWSELSRIYSRGQFQCHLSLAQSQQFIWEEEIRARQFSALFRLRKKALWERTQAELKWLEHCKKWVCYTSTNSY